MKVNLNQSILGLDNKPVNATKEAFVIIRDRITQKEEFLQDSNGNDLIISRETPSEELTLKKQLTNVLLSHTQNLTPQDKVERFALFFRIESNKEDNIEMSAEEISLCKKCNNELASILIAGRVNMMLENK